MKQPPPNEKEMKNNFGKVDIEKISSLFIQP